MGLATKLNRFPPAGVKQVTMMGICETPRLVRMGESGMKGARCLGSGLVLGVILLGLSGCASLSRGTRLEGERVEFIKDGITPKSQVIYNLGQPLFDFPKSRVIGYEWETVDGAFVLRDSKEADCCECRPCWMTEVEWERELQRREAEKRERKAKRGSAYQSPDLHILFVQFDRSKRVVRHGTVVMNESDEVKDVLSKWLKGK